MATKLTDVQSGFGLAGTINENNAKIEAELDAALSRTAGRANQMEQDLDMNGSRIVNLPDAVANGEPITLGQGVAGINVANTAITQANVGAVLYPRTPAEIDAEITPTNYHWPSDDGPHIDIRRYGAVVNGSTDDLVAVQNAVAVAKKRGGGLIFFPEGETKLSATLVVTLRNIQLVGVSSGSKSGYDHQNKGSKIISDVTTTDAIQFGETYKATNCGIIDLAIEATTTGAIVYIKEAAFFKMEKVCINNLSESEGWGVYAEDSHFFSAYDTRFMQTNANEEGVVVAGTGVQFVRSGTIGGQYNFFGCDFHGWSIGISVGQWSTKAWDNSTRDYDGADSYPSPNDDVGLNLFGGQLKSCSTGIQLGSGANNSTITGVYTEGGGFPVKLGYGASNALIQGNMFNMGAGNPGTIKVGQGGDDSERKEFWNIMIKGNWFRNIDDDQPAIQVVGDNTADKTDKSYVVIHDNDFELNTADGFDGTDAVAIDIAGAGSDLAADVRRNTMRGTATPTAYCTGLSSTQRPKVWEDTPISPTEHVNNWSHTPADLTDIHKLTANDPEVISVKTDDNGAQVVALPPAADAKGKQFTIINIGTTDFINVRYKNGSGDVGATLAARNTTGVDTVDMARCVCDGTYWYVYHEVGAKMVIS